MQNFFTIARWTHGEVQPDGAPGVALKQQFVERLPTLLADIEQDGGIADELTDILHPDINGAAGEVVAGGHATHGSVHLGRPVATVDDDGVVALTIAVVPLAAQHLEPATQPFQILDMYVRGDVAILRLHTGFAELSERHVLAEFCLIVDFYLFLHISRF